MALIPPQYLNAVVSIEIKRIREDKQEEEIPIATGFLYGKLVNKDEQTSTYSVYLITNRHVFEDLQTKTFREQVDLRFNLSDKKGAKYFTINLVDNKKPLWFKHKEDTVDLAILPLNGEAIRNENIDFYFFREDLDIFLAKDFEETGVATGDGVFVLGFPLGIRGESRNFTIVKKGIIARFDEELLKLHYYYVDSSAYPGNSGGPVIYKPEIVSIANTKSVNRSALIGVISEGVTFPEVAISQQTGRARIVFEEQTGLVKVVPIDSVIEVINQYTKVKGIPKSKEKVKDEDASKSS